MNQCEREKLVLLIASGCNSYQAIRAALPSLKDIDLKYDEAALVSMVNESNEHAIYHFHPDDQFILTESGESLLYQVRKDRRRERETIISIILSAIAAVTGVIALIC